MKKNEKRKNKIFWPLLIAIIVTILFFYFSMLFVEDYRSCINYIFIGLIYIYVYINLYNIFNGKYVLLFEKYVNLLKKIKIIDSNSTINIDLVDRDNIYKKRLIIVYILLIVLVISLLLFIWQIISRIDFLSVTCITCLVIFILSIVFSIVILRRVINFKSKSKKRIKKNKKKD